jgi:hypothetical protein
MHGQQSSFASIESQKKKTDGVGGEEEGEEFIRLPWRGQRGRAAAGCARIAAALRC